MAVRIDEDAVRDSVDADVLSKADELLSSAAVGEITAVGGGATALVRAGHDLRYETWVGVVGGDFIGECDCDSSDSSPDELCAHAVAVTLSAVRDRFPWSSAATPPSEAMDPEVRRFATMASGLSPRRLIVLIAEFAASDRRIATRLMAQAGVLGPLTEAELATLRRLIDSLAREATTGRWDMHDVVKAGEAIIAELDVLAQRPASEGALLLVEHAAVLWDELASHLFDDWEHFDGVPEEMGSRLREIHLRLCEELQPDPDELARRLEKIITRSEEFTSCLDAPDEYQPLLG
jgi:hypothetical protein